MERIKALVKQPKIINNNVLKFLKDNPKFNKNQYTILPGFIDVHVHFREPGFSYKETILSGSKAASKGGYTTVATMPNLKPVSDTVEHISEQIKLINKANLIKVIPYGSITINEEGEEISPLEDVASKVFAFSDDGKGVQNKKVLYKAMKRAKKLGKVITLHCEVNKLLKGGYIHDGEYAKAHHHKGISSKSEYLEIKRDIKLAKKTGCKLHICHVSAKESVELIRKAKAKGIDITCETAPHYLLLNDSNLKECGYYKINPPIRGKEDQQALIKGIKDGTIDMIATDHAPHSKEEKNKGLKDSLFGASGIEIAFPLLYTYLVKKHIISLDKLIELLVINPSKRFNLKLNDDFSIWDLNKKEIINSNKFLSKGKNTPFNGYEVYGINEVTIHNKKIVYKR